jgi:hypothetical protein
LKTDELGIPIRLWTSAGRQLLHVVVIEKIQQTE